MVAALLLIAPVSAGAATIQIVMQNMEITPAAVAAKVGDTVEWTNKDFVAHTATARNGEFDVNLPPNKTARVVLKKAGTVDYYCRYHPNMTATLKVEP
ncbi:MAG: cupredoxin domain-containing protein [Bradyrhizobium sp.]